MPNKTADTIHAVLDMPPCPPSLTISSMAIPLGAGRNSRRDKEIIVLVATLAALTMLAMASPVLAQIAPPATGEQSRGVLVEVEPSGPVEDIPDPCPPPFSEVDLIFSERADFDARLADRLQGRPARLVLAVGQPYPEKDVPPGSLPKWFAEVQAAGGKVETRQYCDAARGGLRAWLAKLFRPSATANALYKKARGYDVVIHVEALDKKVHQIEWTRR